MSPEARRPLLGARLIALPSARGPISEALIELLLSPPETGCEGLPEVCLDGVAALDDDDLQLGLYLLNELHYTSIEGVDERWEWHPSLAAWRALLEQSFERALCRLVSPAAENGAGTGEALQCLVAGDAGAGTGEALRRLVVGDSGAGTGEALQCLVAEDSGPALSRWLEANGTRQQMIEHVIHRSAYQLKEADPHSFAIPRLAGAPKAALVEIQFDEYGEGQAARIHAELFAATMKALGLDPTYGAYLDRLPGITLATVNLISLFGLHRRFRGALVGHLAVFEMTSSIPNRRYANALRRLGYGQDVTAFYDEHVTADAVHESIAAWDLADALANQEPEMTASILFGARALLALEARWAEHLLASWKADRSSLRGAPLPV